MATSIIKADEIRKVNDTVLISDGALSSNVQFPAGHVIQTLQSVKTDTDSTTSSNTYDTITGTDQNGNGSVFSVVITPKKSGSYFLITAALTMGVTNSNIIMTAIQRDGSLLTMGTGTTTSSMFHFYETQLTANSRNISQSWLDKSANAVAGTDIIYRPVFTQDNNATVYVNRLSQSDAHRALSTFTVMEIST